MQWWTGAHWLVETLYLALLVEEAVLVALCDKEIKLEIATRELHAASNWCPFAESDGLILGCAIGQRITADDVFLQHVSEAFFIAIGTSLVANLVNHFGKKSFATSLGIVGQNVNAVAGTYSNEAFKLPLGWGFDVLQ